MARRWGVAAALCLAAGVMTHGEAVAAEPAADRAATGDTAAATHRGTPVWVRHFSTYTECFYWMGVYNNAGYLAYCAIAPDGIQADFYVIT